MIPVIPLIEDSKNIQNHESLTKKLSLEVDGSIILSALCNEFEVKFIESFIKSMTNRAKGHKQTKNPA